MSGGIGGIGGAGIGMSQMSAVAPGKMDMSMLSIHKKKNHGEDNSFEVNLISLNAQNTQKAGGVQPAAAGVTGLHVNKFA